MKTKKLMIRHIDLSMKVNLTSDLDSKLTEITQNKKLTSNLVMFMKKQKLNKEKFTILNVVQKLNRDVKELEEELKIQSWKTK